VVPALFLDDLSHDCPAWSSVWERESDLVLWLSAALSAAAGWSAKAFECYLVFHRCSHQEQWLSGSGSSRN